jgi:hypothetical protein
VRATSWDRELPEYGLLTLRVDDDDLCRISDVDEKHSLRLVEHRPARATGHGDVGEDIVSLGDGV